MFADGEKRSTMKGYSRHQWVYRALRFLMGPYLKHKFQYTYEEAKVKHRPYIVLSNHNTDWDPFLVGLSFPDPMYFVASDHIFRWGLISKIIKYLVSPIPRIKANKEVETVMQIMRRLNDGANICIFAEGNRSFTGETGQIFLSSGKLIKRCRAALVTYRLEGGYLSSPRWAKRLRRGKMSGRMIREYSPEEIAQMSVDEINAAIARDLYVNADADQQKNPVAYIGKNLAENLETALYLCPRCGQINTLTGRGNTFSCPCGLKLKFTPFGRFESEDGTPPPFSTVLEWSRWQSRQIEERVRHLPPHPEVITSDQGQSLYRIHRARKNTLLGKGLLKLTSQQLILESKDKTWVFPLDQISDMAIHGSMVLVFSTTDRETFEIKTDHPRSALKYVELFKALKSSIQEEE